VNCGEGLVMKKMALVVIVAGVMAFSAASASAAAPVRLGFVGGPFASV
jgi:hypothetical protein